MIEIPVYNREGQAGEKLAVDEAALGAEVNLPVLRQVVRVYESNRRVGTRHVKTRGEVAASTRKLYRQKHTGNARAGARSAPQRRGGGKAHAPEAQDWSQSVPRKVRHVAMRSALLARLKDGEVAVVESPSLEAPKTKAVLELLKSVGAERSCLLVVEGEPETMQVLWKSARNIAGVAVRRACDLNAYDLLRPDRVVFTRPAFEAFMKAHTS